VTTRTSRGRRPALPLLVYAVVAISIAGSGGVYVHRSHQELRAQVERELSSIADSKVAQIVSWRASHLQEWAGLPANPFMAAVLRRAIRTGDQEVRRTLSQVLEGKRERQGALGVLLVDGNGRVVVATRGTAQPNARDLQLLRAALETRDPLVDDGEHAGDPLTVAASIGGEPGERGALLIRYDLARSLTGIVRHWPQHARSAEPVLVRRDGDYVAAVTTPLHTTAPRLPLELDMPTTRAIKGANGIVECDDYRGIPVIAAVRPVPGTPWYLSAKVDRAEVFASGYDHAIAFGSATLLLLGIGAAAVWFWWSVNVARMRERERELEQRTLRYRFDALWSCANDGVLVLDADRRILDTNEHAVEAYGWSREELRRQRVDDLAANASRPDAQRRWEELQRAGSLRFETVHRRKDGGTFPVEVTSLILADEAAYTLCVVRDISDREAAATAARYQATLLENLNDAVIGLDLDTRITAWAGAAQRIYGFSAEEALGRPVAELLRGDHAEEVRLEIAAEAIRTGRCCREVRRVRKDGQRVDVEVTAVLVRSSTGEPRGFVAVHRDLTDHHRAEQERQRLQAKLVFADRLASVGTLAAGVAHEINNPLSYLIGNLDHVKHELRTLALAPGEGRVDQLAALDEAADGARRIGEIVRSLRMFSRRDREDANAVVSVNDAASAAVRMAQAQARPRAKLVVDLGEIPPIAGHEHEIAQVVLNLLLNAIQAIPEGRPRDNEVRLTTRVGSDGSVVLSVRDTGTGVAPEHLRHVFDPFFTTKKVGEGSGLGLSICHGIVERMGGTITLESAVGSGTTFTVRLPRGSVAQGDAVGRVA
jgi:PAS domain S-box-containing protein